MFSRIRTKSNKTCKSRDQLTILAATFEKSIDRLKLESSMNRYLQWVISNKNKNESFLLDFSSIDYIKTNHAKLKRIIYSQRIR